MSRPASHLSPDSMCDGAVLHLQGAAVVVSKVACQLPPQLLWNDGSIVHPTVNPSHFPLVMISFPGSPRLW